MSNAKLLQLCADIEFTTALLEDVSLWHTITSPIVSPRQPAGVLRNHSSSNGSTQSADAAVMLREHSGSGSSVGAQPPRTGSDPPPNTTTTASTGIKKARRRSLKDLDGHKQTLLHSTCFDGMYDDVEHLLKLNEIDINALDKAGWTCLMSAACNGHWRICKLLMKNGADATISSFNGSSALHYLARHVPSDKERGGYSKLFSLLMKKGASLAPNSVGDTPLHSACSKGNSIAAQLLLSQWGRSVNVRNKADWTPLHFCAREGALDVAEMLIKRGADIDAQCVDSQRGAIVLPLDVAKQSGRATFEQMLNARRRDKPKLFRALLRSDHRVALAIVRDHPYTARATYQPVVDSTDPGRRDTSLEFAGRSIAHFFAQRSDISALRTLLADKTGSVDVAALDASGRSVLHLACRFADSKCISLLVENGADPSQLTAGGATCFHMLAKRAYAKDKGMSALFQKLVSCGCDPSRANAQGDLPLHYAAENGNDVLVRFLSQQPNINLQQLDRNGRTPLQCALLSPSSQVAQILTSKGAKQ